LEITTVVKNKIDAFLTYWREEYERLELPEYGRDWRADLICAFRDFIDYQCRENRDFISHGLNDPLAFFLSTVTVDMNGVRRNGPFIRWLMSDDFPDNDYIYVMRCLVRGTVWRELVQKKQRQQEIELANQMVVRLRKGCTSPNQMLYRAVFQMFAAKGPTVENAAKEIVAALREKYYIGADRMLKYWEIYKAARDAAHKRKNGQNGQAIENASIQ